MQRRLGRVPAWAWLTLIVVVSAAFRFQLSRDSPGPWIFVDELIYSELAKSIAAGGDLFVRDVPVVGGYGVVYPLLISPAWALFDSIPEAYTAAKAINAVLISLAAVPAYLLARRLVGEGLSLFAAVLAVALPSLAYSGVIMTENAFYPLFLVVVLSLVLVLERPTLARQIVLVGLLGLAYQTRPQAIALAAAALTAPLVQGLLGRRVRAAVVAQRTLYGIAAAGVVLVLGVQFARGESLSSLLGAYAVVGEGGYHAGAVARYFLYHVAELDLYLGVAPVIAAALLVVVARNTDARLDAFLAAAISVSFWLLLLVATFASQFAGRIQERNLFYLVPLVLIALLAWIERGAPRPARATAVVAIVAAALPGTLPFARLIDSPAVSETLMLLPLWDVTDHGLRAGDLSAVVVPAAIAAAALLLFVPRRFVLALPLLVLVYFLVALPPIERRMTRLSESSLNWASATRTVTGSTAPCRLEPRCPCCGTERASSTPSGRTSSSAAASARSTAAPANSSARCRRPSCRSTSKRASYVTLTAVPCSHGTCSRMTASPLPGASSLATRRTRSLSGSSIARCARRRG